MNRKTDIWMPLYIGDFIADTMSLNAEQTGCYLLWLMAYWRNGPLDNNIPELVQAGKLRSPGPESIARKLLARYFTLEEDGCWHQGRIDFELLRAEEKQSKLSVSGAEGAAAKWNSSQSLGKMARSERLAKARQLARHSPDEWQALKEALGRSCSKCGLAEDIVKDHIVPVYQGGSDGIENIQPMCRKCNASKGPDTTDYRPDDWREEMAKCLAKRLARADEERLAKRLANACQTPAPSPSHSSFNASSDIHRSQPVVIPSGEEVVFELPLRDGTVFGIPQRLHSAYVKAYPALSVMGEYAQMLAWLESNSTNKKTLRGIKAFVNGWLQRAQNNPRLRANGTGAGKTGGKSRFEELAEKIGLDGNAEMPIAGTETGRPAIIESKRMVGVTGAQEGARNGKFMGIDLCAEGSDGGPDSDGARGVDGGVGIGGESEAGGGVGKAAGGILW